MRRTFHFKSLILLPKMNNNNKIPGVFPQMESGEGIVYANLTPTSWMSST